MSPHSRDCGPLHVERESYELRAWHRSIFEQTNKPPKNCGRHKIQVPGIHRILSRTVDNFRCCERPAGQAGRSDQTFSLFIPGPDVAPASVKKHVDCATIAKCSTRQRPRTPASVSSEACAPSASQLSMQPSSTPVRVNDCVKSCGEL